MAELTPKSRGNGYEQTSTSNVEEVSISIPQQASIGLTYEPGTTQSSKRCIQKVPHFLRREEHNKRDYDPAVVSFGPYHHGKPELNLAEDFKPKALELFVAESGKDTDFFYNKVVEVIHDVRRCYVENSTDEYDDAVFARMMLLDACVIINYIWVGLEYHDRMSEAVINHHEVVEATINQLEMFKATIDHLGLLVFYLLIRDMFLLENQIPLWLLKLLINLKYGKDKGEQMLNKFLSIIIVGEYQQTGESKTEEEPLHLLAAFRRILVADCNKGDETRPWSISECLPKRKKLNPVRNTKKYAQSFRSVTDLKAKGIQFSCSNTTSLKDIKFKSSYFHGKLQLPIWGVSLYAKVLFLNLVAFEMCPNTFTDQTVSSYINFMKSLIESPKDVKELREKKILLNALGDEEMMQVYKDINTFGVNNYGMFYEIREKIQEHYNNKAKTWVAELIHTYFSSPWTAIALLAAICVLCSTFLQTYFTIHPSFK